MLTRFTVHAREQGGPGDDRSDGRLVSQRSLPTAIVFIASAKLHHPGHVLNVDGGKTR